MFRIIKNTYPKDKIGIGMHEVGTLCQWVIERGHLILKKCDSEGRILERNTIKIPGGSIDTNVIFSHGQIYALNGNLLSGRKEPERVGIVAKYVKNGCYLEIEFCKQ